MSKTRPSGGRPPGRRGGSGSSPTSRTGSRGGRTPNSRGRAQNGSGREMWAPLVVALTLFYALPRLWWATWKERRQR